MRATRTRENKKGASVYPAPLNLTLMVFCNHCDCKQTDNTESEPKRYQYDPPAPVDHSCELQDNQNDLDDIQHSEAGCFHCITPVSAHDYLPVWPKPPSPRSVSDRSSTSTNSGLRYGPITICAIRSLWLIVCSVCESLCNATMTSPR